MSIEEQSTPPTIIADKEKILFVDDDPINVESFLVSFCEEYNVFGAHSGEEALEIFHKHPDICVVLSDQRMDGMSGVELLSTIYSQAPDTVRIIITGYVDVSDILDAINRGHIYQYVLKPWDIVQLRLILEQATQTWALLKENKNLAAALREKNQMLRQANEHLQESEEQLRFLSAKLIDIRESEQKRIALELHDELGQSLAALKLQIRIVEQGRRALRLQGDDNLFDDLQQLRASVADIIENVRRLSTNLSPIIIDDLGIDAALEYLAQSFTEIFSIPCTLSVPSISDFFPKNKHPLIYRLLQGALSNSGKHSGADQVTVTAKVNSHQVLVEIQDNGRGFSKEETAAMPMGQRGIGLIVMAERAKMLGGQMEIETFPEKGTTVRYLLPCTAHRADT